MIPFRMIFNIVAAKFIRNCRPLYLEYFKNIVVVERDIQKWGKI